ncbi:MAG TPA: energy conserving hydrogenase EhbF [Methanothermococcus okinawensis]|uniref:Energy conserving hydrogenase EhbF n=1 Tax=Methanothermococcus okinawensis TaxID=155863 RepID=A0A832ZY83_9EURY|nr:energy conserving hydrogenase EhbF [Methanothermococcus okinawensis]
MNLLPLIVVIPLLMAIVFSYIYRSKYIRLLTLLMALVLLVLPLLGLYGPYFFGGHGVVYIEGMPFVSGILYTLNPLKETLIFTLMLIGVLVLIISTREERLSGTFTALVLMGLASVSAVILTEDLFNLYVFYEIAAITQAGLVILAGREEAYRSAFRYLLVGTMAGSILLLGVGLLLSATGSLNIVDMGRYLALKPLTPTVYGALLMLIVGLAYGGGLPPFHTLKVDLYSRTKPFVAAILQTYSKFILIALMLVILKLFGGLPIFNTTRGVLIALSVFAMVFGTVMALLQDDYRRLLAYHTVSQGGYVALGLALGTPLGIVAGIFHGINHALYKSALFIGAHIVEKIKSPYMREVGGLLLAMPTVTFLILCAKLASIGIPPFNGFQSKLLLAEAVMSADMPELVILMLIVSIGTFLYMMKAFYLIFLKPCSEEQLREYREVRISKYHIFSLGLLVLLCIVLGLYPDMVLDRLLPLGEEIAIE